MAWNNYGCAAAHEKFYKNFQPPIEAPTFHPTKEEFEDPISYIQSLRVHGEKHGIIKIIPPEFFKPKFAINEDKFFFAPRKQKLNDLEAVSRVRKNFHAELSSFWYLSGQQLLTPQLDKKYLDFYKLHKKIEEFGGFEHVSKEKNWCKIAKQTGFINTSGSALKAQYKKWVLPFVTSLEEKKEQEKKDHEDKVKMEKNEPRRARRSRDAQERPKPTFSMRTRRSGMKCEDEFNESDDSVTIVAVRQPKRMAGIRQPTDSSNKYSQATAKPPSIAEGADIVCQVCGSGDNEEQLLLCTTCHLMGCHHLYCLEPPLKRLPEGDWSCPKCVRNRIKRMVAQGYGFEYDKKEHSLRNFGNYANEFKRRYFDRPLKEISVDEVEKEFWKLVVETAHAPQEPVEVRYGADLFTSIVGSGFCRPQDTHVDAKHREQYANHAWNVNNIAKLRNSVLSHISEDISGMTVPWIYIGMVFSTFCWHVEDHWSPSINFMHWGEPKIWYGVGEKDASLLEETMRHYAPELFVDNPGLLHEITTIMNPNVLQAAGVEVCRVEQCPGEFVVTFPRGYHAGFNSGYNCAEAVNFAPAYWLSIGRLAVESYKPQKRRHVFSHDELIMKIARSLDHLDPVSLQELAKDIETMIKIERKLRNRLDQECVTKSEQTDFTRMHDDERTCSVCKATLYLSAVKCACDDADFVCLEHFEEACTTDQACPATKLTLHYQHSMDELHKIVDDVQQAIVRQEDYIKTVQVLLNGNIKQEDDGSNTEKKISIDRLRQLAAEARAIGLSSCDSTVKRIDDALRSMNRLDKLANYIISPKTVTRNREQTLTKKQDKTVNNVYRFEQTLDAQPYAVSKYAQFKNFVEKLREWQNEASLLLAECPRDVSGQSIGLIRDHYERLRKQLDIGVEFNLSSDEIEHLQNKVALYKWFVQVDVVIEANNILQRLPVNDVDEDVSEKRFDDNLSIASTSLSELDHKITVDHLLGLMEDHQAIVNSDNKSVEQRVDALIRINSAIAHNQSIVDTLTGQNVSYEECLSAIAEICPLNGIRQPGVDDFRRNLRATHKWMKKYASTLTNDAIYTLPDLNQLHCGYPALEIPVDKQRLSAVQHARNVVDATLVHARILLTPRCATGIVVQTILPRNNDINKLLEINATPPPPKPCTISKCDQHWQLCNVYPTLDACKTVTEFEQLLNTDFRHELSCIAQLRQHYQRVQLNDSGQLLREQVYCNCVDRPETFDTSILFCRLCNLACHVPCQYSNSTLSRLGDNAYLCSRCCRGSRPELSAIRTLIDNAFNQWKQHLETSVLPHSREMIILKIWLNRALAWEARARAFLERDPLVVAALIDARQRQSGVFGGDDDAPSQDEITTLSGEHQTQLNILVIEGILSEVCSDTLIALLLLDHCVRPRNVQLAERQLMQQLKSQPSGPMTSTAHIASLAGAKRQSSLQETAPRKQRKRGPKPRSGKDKEEDSQCSAMHCLRPSHDVTTWLQCEAGCDNWFHILCVGLTQEAVDEIDSYVCQRCAVKSLSTTPPADTALQTTLET